METSHSLYSKLYSKDNDEDPRNLDAFLEGTPLPTLTDSHCSLLESPISETDLLDIIKGLRTRSTPGPDGFSNCYCKVFSHTLSPYMVRYFNDLRKGKPLDPAADLAFISVIPKPVKDYREAGN